MVPVCSLRLIAPRKRVSPEGFAGLPLLQQATPVQLTSLLRITGVSHDRDLAGSRYELVSTSVHAAVLGMGAALVVERELQDGGLIVPLRHASPFESGLLLRMPGSKARQPDRARLTGLASRLRYAAVGLGCNTSSIPAQYCHLTLFAIQSRTKSATRRLFLSCIIM